jgi:hypothetical protein
MENTGADPADPEFQGSATLVSGGAQIGALTAETHATSSSRFAVQYLLAAAHFSRRVGEIESRHVGEPIGPFWDEILWYATACVSSAVASLEAYANELFIDRSQNFPGFDAKVMDQFWEHFEGEKILDKFDLVLLLRNRPALKRGAEPAQSVIALIGLRDQLTHFKPGAAGGQKAHDKVSKGLQSLIEPSPFWPPGPLFPERWASHNCATWAVNSCLAYADAFAAAAGLPPKFDLHRPRLVP